MMFSFLVFFGLCAAEPASFETQVFPFEQAQVLSKTQVIDAFPSPQGPLKVKLEPLSIWHQQARIEVIAKNGSRRAAPQQRGDFLHGVSESGVLVFVSRGANGNLRGFTRSQAGTWGFSGFSGQLVYSKAAGRAFECRAREIAGNDLPTIDQNTRPKKDINNAIVDLALETDTELFQQFEDVEKMKTAVAESMAAISAIYQRDFGAELRIVYLAAYPEEDPWEYSGIDELQSHWQDPRNGKSTIQRTLTHLLSAQSFYGVGFIDTLCNPDWGFGRSSFYGVFADDPSDFSDINLVAHELGHNFGSPHTHDYFPPIDRCPTFTGELPEGGGTLMGYCFRQTAAVEISVFHPRVQEWVRGRIAARPCIPLRRSTIVFSDDAFKQAVVAAHDGNNDGEIDHDEAEAITELTLDNLGIGDLNGMRYFANLESLNASNNQITEIPRLLPATLKTLILVGNPLSANNCDRLVSLQQRGFETLELQAADAEEPLDCTATTVSFADAALQAAVLAVGDGDEDGSLSVLEASQITVLDAANAGISDLAGLDQLPNLTILLLPGNQISTLPTLPAKLMRIDLANNQLTDISAITPLKNLGDLDVSNNQLTELPPLNHYEFIDSVIAAGNQLTALPELRQVDGLNTLIALDFGGNQLSSLPALPRLLFGLDLRDNNLTEVPEILPLNYPFAQQVNLSGNRLTTTGDTCAKLATLLERDMGQFAFEPQQELTRFDCYSIGSMPALAHVVPWVVNNDNYQSTLNLQNNEAVTNQLVLRAVSAEETQTTTLELEPFTQRSVLAADLFPTMNRYTLMVHSNNIRVGTDTVVRNINGPSAGAGGNANGSAYDAMTNKIAMTGLTGTSVAVLSLPGSNQAHHIAVDLHGPDGQVVARREFTSQGEAPLPLIIPQAFPEAVGLDSVAIVARAPESVKMCGTAFYFEGWAEFATTASQPYFGFNTLGIAMLGADRSGSEIHIFNAENRELSLTIRAYGATGADFERFSETIPAQGSAVFRPDQMLPFSGPTTLWFFSNGTQFATMKVYDGVGSGSPAPVAANLINPNSINPYSVRFNNLSAAKNVLYLSPLLADDAQTVELTLLGADNAPVEVYELAFPATGTAELDLAEIFTTTDLSELTLELTSSAEEEYLAALLRQYDEDGRSLLRLPLP